MHVGARTHIDWLRGHHLVEVIEQSGVRPGLIGGVKEVMLPATDERADVIDELRRVHYRPLLELDDAEASESRFVVTRHEHVDALASAVEPVLDGDPSIVGDPVVRQDMAHGIAKGVPPTRVFT